MFEINSTPITKDNMTTKDVHMQLQIRNVTFNTDESTLQTSRDIHWISSVLIATIFIAIGLVGNTLSISVWKKRSMRSSTGTYLTAQAVADTGLLIFFFLTDSLVMMYPEVKSLYIFGLFYSYIGYPVFIFFVILSIWTTVGVTVDRYIHVRWSLRAMKIAGRKNALIGIGLITLLCFVVNIPHFKTYRPVGDEERDVDGPAFIRTDFGSGKGSKTYEFWLQCILLVFVPWLTVLFLNILIVHRVYKTNREMATKRDKNSNETARRSENQLTKLLLTVTFTFLGLVSLQCVTQCFLMLPKFPVDEDLKAEIYAIANLGVVINSSINFFIYCLNGRRFRQELQKMLAERYGDVRMSIFVSDSSANSRPETATSFTWT